MTTRIGKRFTFSAAHRLAGLPEGHKCGRLHGHTYTVEVVAAGPVTGPGWLVDFADLQPVGDYITNQLDHRLLNDALPDVAPTSELLARHLYDWCTRHLPLPAGVRVEAVRVSESPTTWAEYRP